MVTYLFPILSSMCLILPLKLLQNDKNIQNLYNKRNKDK